MIRHFNRSTVLSVCNKMDYMYKVIGQIIKLQYYSISL